MTQIDTKFRGRVITVNVEQVTLPNGSHAALEIIHHPGGSAVVALDDRQRICLLRQFRHAAGGWVWELPAGKLEPGEAPLLTAQRELIEEAGVAAVEWRSLGTSLSSPGVFTEVIHLYLASDLQPAVAAHESNEVIEVHWVNLRDAWQRAATSEIVDSKTVIGLFRAQALLQGSPP
ncbi:MAG: NUDIX hydrolase [Pseudomonadota bacterium]